MTKAIIKYVGEMPYHSGGDTTDDFPFVPVLEATVEGDSLVKAWIQLSFEGGVNARTKLQRSGQDPDQADSLICTALLLYGVRRLELVVADLLEARAVADPSYLWRLGTDDVSELLMLVADKECRFQKRSDGDLYCLAAGAGDTTVVGAIDGRRAAPTTKALCQGCGLPNTTYVCGNLRHVGVVGLEAAKGIVDRQLVDALCDLGRPEVDSPSNCRAGGHPCWQRTVSAERGSLVWVSALSLPESFDVLDSMWRLAFGKSKRLLSLGTTTVPAAIAQDCSNRTEFESRISALADLIDLLRVDDDLLPTGLTDEEKTGSLNRLEKCLLSKLPAGQHAQIGKAITLLRRVRQTRNAMQHSAVDGGFTKSLRQLGILDAPPNWRGAWASIQAHTVDALTILRTVLLRWLDAQP